MKTTSIALLAIALVFGCKNNAPNTTANTPVVQSTTMTPEELGELGAKIKKSPNDAQKILSDRGLTQESFEQAVRKVAENPDQSKRYAAAYKKAS